MGSLTLSFSLLISFIIRFLVGQIISFAISCTGAFSTLLIVNGKNSSLPVLQSTLSYLSVCLIWGAFYVTYVFRRRRAVNEKYCFNFNKGVYDDKKIDLCVIDKDIATQVNDTRMYKNNNCFFKFVDWCRKSGDAEDNKGYKGVCGTGNRCFLSTVNLDNGNKDDNNSFKRLKSVIKLLGQYALVAIFDLEASYIYIKAYQYTDQTSVQLLDSCTVPFVMLLSYFLINLKIISVNIGDVKDNSQDEGKEENDENKCVIDYKVDYTANDTIDNLNSDCNEEEKNVNSTTISTSVLDYTGIKTKKDKTESALDASTNKNDKINIKYRYYTEGYQLWNFIGIIVAVAGIVIMILFDVDGLNRKSSYYTTADIIKGDIFVLISSLLFALSNVFTERTLTNNNNDGETKATADEVKVEGVDNTMDKNDENRDNNKRKISLYSWLNPFSCGNGDDITAIPPLFIVVLLEYMTFMSMFGFIFGVCQFFAVGEHKLLPFWGQKVVMPCNDASSINKFLFNLLNSSLNHNNTNDNGDTSSFYHTYATGSVFNSTVNTASEDIKGIVSISSIIGNYINNANNLANNNITTGKNCSYYDSNVTAFADVANGADYSSIGYLVGYILSSFTCYTFIPVLFIISTATFGNLSFLTADFYSIIFNVTLFAIYPLPYFFVPYLIIVIGIILYDTNGIEGFRGKIIKYIRSKKIIRNN